MMQILLYTLKVGEIHTDMHYIKYKNIYFRVNLGVPPHFFPTPFDNTGFVFTKQGILYLYIHILLTSHLSTMTLNNFSYQSVSDKLSICM